MIVVHVPELALTLFVFLQTEAFPASVGKMTGLRWLKLNRTGLQTIPEELGNLQKLVSSVTLVVDEHYMNTSCGIYLVLAPFVKNGRVCMEECHWKNVHTMWLLAVRARVM